MRTLGISQHCLNFYEIHETKGKVYIVYEFAKGGTLQDYIDSRQKKNKKLKISRAQTCQIIF